jgi:hypothetical protein
MKLKNWKIPNANYSLFSSPYSEIYEGNIIQYFDMLKNNNIKYLRSGNQVRRNGLLYCLLYILQMVFKSRYLFYVLNKQNIMNIDHIGIRVDNYNTTIIKAVAVKNYNSINQLKYMLQRLRDNEVIVFLFHGIIYNNNIIKKDSWIFSADEFEKFLKIIKLSNNIQVLNIKDYINNNSTSE